MNKPPPLHIAATLVTSTHQVLVDTQQVALGCRPHRLIKSVLRAATKGQRAAGQHGWRAAAAAACSAWRHVAAAWRSCADGHRGVGSEELQQGLSRERVSGEEQQWQGGREAGSDTALQPVSLVGCSIGLPLPGRPSPGPSTAQGASSVKALNSPARRRLDGPRQSPRCCPLETTWLLLGRLKEQQGCRERCGAIQWSDQR